MKINEIIKEKRIKQGLTQEQIANYLGVSTPAVNKWEKGSSYPDITLLPALARILKTDLNTLLSFKEDLSEQEIAIFANELSLIIRTKDFPIAFEKAMEKIQEYPTCDKLLFTTAAVLQGGLYMCCMENKKFYEEYIENLYEKLSNSDDIEIRNQAISMLINKYLGRKEFDKAQACIDSFPNVTYDKKQQQGNLYLLSGQLHKAGELFEQKLLSTTTELFIILTSLMDIALKENRNNDAKYLAEVLEKTTHLYDLWDYNSYAGYLQLYTTQKDSKNSISTLRKMLYAMSKKWNPLNSPLYKHIKAKNVENEPNEELLSAFINMLKHNDNEEFNFLKDDKEFLELLNEFNTK